MNSETIAHNIVAKMELLAQQAAKNAYCPYSNFYVGAAVLGNDDHIYAGCNVENAAYGSTICAESNAISSAITAGVKTIKAVLVYTSTKQHTFPCGNCRQMLNEFATDIPVYLLCDQQPRYHTRLTKLLPDGFNLDNLASLIEKEQGV